MLSGDWGDCIVLDHEERDSTTARVGLRSLDCFDAPVKSGKQDPCFRTEHCEIFRESNISWPPDRSAYLHIDFRGMGERVGELIVLLDTLFPFPVGPGIQFLDANPSMKRLLMTNSEGKYKDPWKPYPGTLTGMTQLVLRARHDEELTVRRVEIVELFSMIGWFDDMWGSSTKDLDVLDIGLASSLVGNAFSAFHAGPAMLAFLPAAFKKPIASGLPVVVVEEVVVDDDGSASKVSDDGSATSSLS